MDLLTVLEHELGHILGYYHTDTRVMSPTLATGVRETPTAVIDQFFAGVSAKTGTTCISGRSRFPVRR